jgi:hypothetical protein
VKAVAEADLPAEEVYNYLGWHNGEVEFETINMGWETLKRTAQNIAPELHNRRL